jgi:hypothetical protein
VSVFTVLFAIGQAIGPVLIGWLADITQSLYTGLAASVAILLAASAAALCQRESRVNARSLVPMAVSPDGRAVR